jgi:hypothetical protein
MSAPLFKERDLRDENQELRDQLDAVANIVSPDDENGDKGGRRTKTAIWRTKRRRTTGPISCGPKVYYNDLGFAKIRLDILN